MARQPLGIAILGTGQAARLHSVTLRRLGGVRLLHGSRERDRARRFAAAQGGGQAFGSYAEAIAAADTDVVLVTTPPPSHRDLACAALRQGRDVILEKPALLRADHFAELRREAAAAGRRVLVAENYHYKPLVSCLRRLLAEDAVGDPIVVRVNALKSQAGGGWRDDPAQAGGGALFEGGIHWVCFMTSLGLEPVDATGFCRYDERGLDRTVAAVFRYEGGAVGSLAYSWEVPSLLRGVRLSSIHGTRGRIDFESNGLFVACSGRRRRLQFPDLRDLAGYRAMFRDFVRVLREGGEPAYTLAAAERDLRLVERIHARSGPRSPRSAGAV
ncbi:MAG: Gfo/Idh/MocA family oxidoreductase [Candidatus Krumholzibacteriia bacterium]